MSSTNPSPSPNPNPDPNPNPNPNPNRNPHQVLPQVVPSMEVDGWGGRKMHDAMSSTTQGGGIRLCGMNALRDAAEGEGGFFFSGPIRLGVPRAQVWRETLERSLR